MSAESIRCHYSLNPGLSLLPATVRPPAGMACDGHEVSHELIWQKRSPWI